MNTRRGGSPRQKRQLSAIAAVLALVLVAGAGWARPLSDQERASLAAAVESFEVATREGNVAHVARTMPPKVIGAIARASGETPDQIVASMTRMTQHMLREAGIKIESFGMDFGSADHKELASGEPYVLIPSQIVMAVGDQRVRERSHTLAFLEGGEWFLLRIDDGPYVEILRDAYPEFTGVEFPPVSTEALNP